MSDEVIEEALALQKKHGNKKSIPELLEIPEKEETISYSKANELTKKKRVLSDKQKENVLKLIASNKEKREAKAREEHEAELKAKAEEESKIKLEEAKKKVKLVRVLPKRVNKRSVSNTKKVVFEAEEEEEEEESDEDPMPVPRSVSTTKQSALPKDESDADTTDTKVLKKKIKKLDMMNKIQKSVSTTKPVQTYERSILKNSGFIL